jgi:hypothetical protein
MAAAYNMSSGEKIMNAYELINESVRKTNDIKRTLNSHL